MGGITVLFLVLAILANALISMHMEYKLRDQEGRLEKIEARYRRLIYGRKTEYRD